MKNRIHSNEMTICLAFHQAIASVAERKTIEKTELVSKTHAFCPENSKIQRKQVEEAVRIWTQKIDKYCKNLLNRKTSVAYAQTSKKGSAIQVKVVSFYLKNLKTIHLIDPKSKRILEQLKLCNAFHLPIQGVVDIEFRNQNGQTPLHLAAMTGNVESVHVLLENGANIYTRDHFNRTPIHLASLEMKLEMIELVEKKQLEHFTLWKAPNPLIEEVVDIKFTNHKSQTSLHLAVMTGNIPITCFLLAGGADIEARDCFDRTPMHLAALTENRLIVRFLFEKGANIDARGPLDHTPMHLAAMTGNVEGVRFFFENGANIEARDLLGRTPMHLAAMSGHVEVIGFLLEVGANICVRDLLDRTPMHLAALGDNLEVIERLEKQSEQEKNNLKAL